MSSARRFLWLFLAGGLLGGGFVMRGGRGSPSSPEAPEGPPPAASQPSADRNHPRLAREWRELLAECGESRDPEVLRNRLKALKERWLEEEPEVLAGVIGQLLRQGDDAPTGLPFETGPGGALRGWPTLRVFLLDTLAVTDPDLAGAIAREVLATTASAEEFAVALKPLLLGGPWLAPAAELEGHFSKLLENPAWQDKAGLAEALDLSRVAATPATTAVLARWVDRCPVAIEAGAMALHETAAAEPALVVGMVAKDPKLFQARPELRASLLARASASDPEQTAGLETYLKNPEVPIDEKKQFLNLFPLRSTSTGYRLYGSPPSPYVAEAVRADDRAALEAVARWMNDPSLSALEADLAGSRQRIAAWVKQSDG